VYNIEGKSSAERSGGRIYNIGGICKMPFSSRKGENTE
jgi:hypothetical protein